MAKKTPPFQWGKSPDPTNWYETAEALESLRRPIRKPNPFLDKLASLEQLVKDQKDKK